MDLNPTIISYRSQTDQTSHFVNLDDLLKIDNYKNVKQVYDDIYRSVTAYEPDHVNSLKKVEGKLYNRVTQLENEKKEELITQKNAKIVLSILTLGIRTLVFLYRIKKVEDEIKEMDKNHKAFIHSLSQMEQRHLDKELHAKPEKIVELEKNRLENPEDELNRLKLNPRIAKSLQKVTSQVQASLPTQHQVAIGRSIELREQLKDTHYVINHGQNFELMIVNIVARILKQEFEPHQYESFEPLRHDTALRHIKEDTQTVAWYQNQINSGVYNDHSFRRELICGDCVLESTAKYESAIDFFAFSMNIAHGRKHPTFIKNILMSIVQDYIPNYEVANTLCDDLERLLTQHPWGGNLYSICVPKEKFDESCYFSQPFGVALENQQKLKGLLDVMQEGEGVYPSGMPQIRVLTHKVRAEDGFHVILNSTFSSNQLSKIEDEVATSIQAALTGYRIQKKPDKIF